MHDVQRAYDDPFVQVPSSDLTYMMQNCKPTTVCVYLSLMIRSNRKRGYTCFPSYSTIAKDAGVSRRTAITALEELQTHGFVTVEPRIDEEGDQTSNMYWLQLVREKSAQGSENPAPPPVQNMHHPVVQNLHPNHKNLTEPDETEQYSDHGEDRSLPTGDTTPEFDAFWQAYPRKKNKGDARKAWRSEKITPTMLPTILASIQAHCKTRDWQKDGGQFIPYPATWLRAHGWEDEPDTQIQKPHRFVV